MIGAFQRKAPQYRRLKQLDLCSTPVPLHQDYKCVISKEYVK